MTYPKLDLSALAPNPKKNPFTTVQLGRTRVDHYAWLKDENWQAVMQKPETLSPDIHKHLEMENGYTKAAFAPLNDLKDTLFEELKNRLESEDSSVPSPDGVFTYYHRFRKGDQHGVYARKACTPDTRDAFGEEITLLDADAIAKEGPDYFDLGSTAHSPNHEWFTYSVDRKGSENYEVFLVKAGSLDAKSTGITKSAGGLEWARDNRTLFWVERDENQRPYAVFSKDIINSSAKPRLVYKEDDARFFVSVSESASGRYIEISAHNHVTTEIHRIPSNAPENSPICVSPRKEGREYSLAERGDKLFVLSNSNGAVDFQIMVTDDDAPEAENWKPFITHKPGRLILGLESYANHLVWMTREEALPVIYIHDLKKDETHKIAFDEAAYALGLSGGYEFDTEWVRFSYSSPTTPRQTFDYNMRTRERILRKTQKVPSGHNPDDYRTERLSITARDGETVPVTLLYHVDHPPSADSPCLLYGYGSYGITIPASFSTTRLSLVNRGVVYAIAHIRGSMAKGYQWYLKFICRRYCGCTFC